MAKGLWHVTSGESYFVRADSYDEAVAVYHVVAGNATPEEYDEADGFDFSKENLEAAEYDGVNTVAESILDLFTN